MKFSFPFALTAALIFGCSSASKSTRTAGNDTGTTQSGSIEGTQGTAGGANGTQSTASTGTSAQTSGQSANTSTGTDTNAQGSASTPNSGSTSSTYGQNGGSGSASANTGSTGSTGSMGTAGNTGSTSGSAGNSGSGSGSMGTAGNSGSTYGQNSTGSATGSAGGSGAVASGSGSSDNASLRTVTGAVAKVDQNSITLDQTAGGVTLTIDSQTQVLRRGQPVAAGISAIHEGQQIRASFDPASNRADKIEVMGKGMAKHHHTVAPGSSATPQPGAADTTPPAK